MIINSNEEYEVNEILNSWIKRKKLEYLVDWSGYDISHQSWEPAKNLKNSQELINEFHQNYPEKTMSKGSQSSPLERELLS